MPAIFAWGTEEWALVVGLVVTAIGWVREARKARSERKEKEALQAEMTEIQRRGRAPFLRATHLHVPRFGGNPNQILHPGQCVDPALLIGNDVKLQLQIANDGEEVRAVGDDWPQGQGISAPPGGLPQALRAGAITYTFDSAKWNQPMRIRIHFETLDGLKLHHVYELRHGVCELRRVDPL